MMSKLKQILLQRSNGIGLQTISKTLDISRNTVKKYLRLIEVRGYNPVELLDMSDEALEVLLDHPEPTHAQPVVTPAATPAASSPEVPSPDLQPGNGVTPPPEAPSR